MTEQKRKRVKKEKVDPICEACRTRNKAHVPDHACAWCKEEQEKKGRRAWVTGLGLGTVHCGDMEILGEQIPDESIDVIFTDPPYVKELWENAFAELAMLASRVLKPGGFLFTYAPQAHLDEIMDLLRHTTPMDEGLSFFWIISSLNSGQVAKDHKHNALCLHKPILVFQNPPKDAAMKGARRCFADVVRGFKQKRFHAWQQSVHDVLGIIDRFMVPGEILLDPFAGWGTSLIAANLLGMEWVGFEIEPDRQKIAMERLQQKPIALEAFGVEAEPAECEREPVPEQKDTSKQGRFPEFEKVLKDSRELCDNVEISSKKRSRIDKPESGIKTEPADPATEARAVELHAACLDCEGRDDCRTHDPRAGCLDAVRAIQEAVKEKEQKIPIQDSYAHNPGPQPFVQHCCGTCGHHKGRKTFHESCPRLGELLFKGGTKSAKVLMEETQREICKHWIKKWDTENENPPCKDFDRCTHSDRDRCATLSKTRNVKCLAPVRPKKDTPEWFAAMTEAKRKNNPHWLWEVWKHDPTKGEWLYEGASTYPEVCTVKTRCDEMLPPHTNPGAPSICFTIRPRPKPDYDPNDIEGPCKTCTIECLDDNDGCQEFDQHSSKLDSEGDAPGEIAIWPVCIISCGKTKIWDNPGKKKPKARVYAQDAYTGPLFTSAKNYAEQRHQGPWYILSDKYGLILPGEEIENYDISPEDIKDDPDFFEAVHHRARSDPDLSRAKKIVLIAGKIHQDIIERVFPGVEIYNPVQGLPQGKRMQVLKNLTAEKSASRKSKKQEETES